VHGPKPEGLKDHHLEGAREEVATFSVSGHIATI
jgi:hypothetical protein